jgi:dCMP deaminase
VIFDGKIKFWYFTPIFDFKIGAVIVGPNNEPISFGFNGLPRKVNDHVPLRFVRPEKYLYFEHAERNAIYSLPRIGAMIPQGSKMFTNGLPCADCGRAIIQVGISEVIIHEPFELIFHHLYNDWNASCDATGEMFQESEVKIRKVSEFIGMDGWINGRIIHV